MSKSWAPAPDDQPVHSTKIRFKGVDTASPAYMVLLGMFSGKIGQFYRSQQQQVGISGQRYYKTGVNWGDARATYQNNEGQETVWVEVSPEILQQAQQSSLNPIYEYELGGYIFFWIDHVTGPAHDKDNNPIPTIPVDFSFKINDSSVISGTFTDERDSSFLAAVVFGKNALHYHSHADAMNDVTQKFVSYPSPKRESAIDRLDEFGNPYSGDLPEYTIFTKEGSLQFLDMSYWQLANTPIYYIGGESPVANRDLGGGVTKFPDLTASPLNLNGENRLAVDINSPISRPTIDGFIFGEFFSRELREVKKTWRFAAAPGQTAFVNDRAAYFQASFTNNTSLSTTGSQVPYGNFFFPYNSIPGMLSGDGLTADAPNDYQDDTVLVRELILDLSK